MALARGRRVVTGLVSLEIPGDKSISHRALMLAALADGTSAVRGILLSADVQSTAAALRALGVEIGELTGKMRVQGRGLRGFRAPARDLDCGNSGTTTRLLTGIVSAMPFASRFVGDDSLSHRPMHRISDPLGRMGARFEFERGDGLPMRVLGGDLASIDWQSSTASAQVKSAILLAALVAGVPASVSEPARSRDHTERMLRAMGVSIDVAGGVVRLSATSNLTPLDVDIPGDPSSAAFPLALAALGDGAGVEMRRVCLNETRAGFVRAMRAMGARIEILDRREESGEPVGTLRAFPSRLRGIAVSGDVVPSMIDELPLLACVASRAEGVTEIAGASELRVKESDRIAAVVANLRAIGVDADERPDGLVVRGGDEPLRGSVITYGDHRVAMAFGILAALPGNEIAIDDRACVAVSYPGFWTDIDRMSSE
ncbi:MAG: 3-phosphoshikimate 1-carboxyvinyltransferase [Gemmatimonadota bacterium]|nr:3-phosphoshikimate 1-carboxyvinyltransferase [Gemmatimonadota bacterium]